MNESSETSVATIAVVAGSPSERLTLAAPFRRFGAKLEELERADDLRLLKATRLLMVVACEEQVSAARNVLDEGLSGRLVPVVTVAAAASVALGEEGEELLAHARELSRDQKIGGALDEEATKARARFSTDAVAIGPYRPEELPEIAPAQCEGEDDDEGGLNASGGASFENVNDKAGISMPIIGLTLAALIGALVVLIFADANEDRAEDATSNETANAPEARALLAAQDLAAHVDSRAHAFGVAFSARPSAPTSLYRPADATLEASYPVRCLQAVQQERWEDALSVCGVALAEEPQSAPLFAASLVATGSTRLAIGLLREYVESYPDDASGWIVYGDAQSRLGEVSAARAAWRNYLELEPEGRWADDVREVLESPPEDEVSQP